jgi:hypothetical protein
MIDFLAQTATEIPTWITAAIQNLGIGAVLVWHLYHTTTKTMPEMQNIYLASQKEISLSNSNTHKMISDNFILALKEERDHRRLETLEERAMRNKELEELRDYFAKENSCKYTHPQQ